MKEILNEKHLEVLRKVQTLVPQAAIAGSAVREYVLDSPFNDLSIFIPVTGIKKAKEYPLGFFFEEILPDTLGADLGGEDSYEMKPDLYGIGDLTYRAKIGGTRYKFTGCEYTIKRIVYGFPLNINQVYHNGETVVKSPIFSSGMVTKELWSIHGSVDRILAHKMMDFCQIHSDWSIRKDQLELVKDAMKRPSIYINTSTPVEQVQALDGLWFQVPPPGNPQQPAVAPPAQARMRNPFRRPDR